MMKSINDPEIIDWIDYMSDKLDKYEIYRNEYLAEFDQAPRNLRFYEDVLMPFCENTLIMDNIASSENLCFENGKINNKLKIECYINGNRMTCKYPAMSFIIPHSNCNGEISYPDNFPYLMKHKDFGNDINKNKFILKSAFAQRQITKRENDIEITLHSEQAFYSILENVIRNSAKHNKDECAKKGLTIFIDIRESEDKNNYELTIYDNVSELKGSLLFGDKKNQGIYQRLNESLLDESGGVRRENWGFADIRINSFLFFNRGDEITNENMASNIDLVKVIELKTGVGCDYNSSEILSPSFEIINNQKSIENDKVYSFGYQMKISKAKKILWVGDLIKKWNIEEFRKNGFVQIRDLKELDNKEKSMQNGGISAFDFVIFNRKLTEADLEENVNMKRKKPNYEVKLPGRILCINKDERIIKPNIIEIDLNCFDKINDVNSILEVCWKQWLKALDKNIKLYIYYEDESFNDSWKNNLLDEFLEFKVVKKDQNVNICEKDFNIILENHGNAKNTNAVIINNNINFYTDNNITAFDKGSEDYATLAFPPDDEFRQKLLLYSIIDSAFTNIFILDERIANVSNENHNISLFSPHGNIPGVNGKNWSMYVHGNVFVFSEIKTSSDNITKLISGDVSINLALCVNKENISIKSTLPKFKDIDEIKKDAIIIHRTYLDNKITGKTPKEFIKLLMKTFGTVIVTSGGGYPHNLDTEVKFVPFSLVEKTINSRLSKLKLNSIIKTNTRK